MSGYLNNLVLRTLDLAPVAQPRLASAFEASLLSRSSAQTPAPLDSATTAQTPHVPGPLVHELRTQVQVVPVPMENKEFARSTIAQRAANDLQSAPQEKAATLSPVVESGAEIRNQNQIANLSNLSHAVKPQPFAKEVVEIHNQPKAVAPRIVRDQANDAEGLWRKFKPRIRNVVQEELSASSTPPEDASGGPIMIQPPPALAPVAQRSEPLPPMLPRQAVITNNPLPIAVPAPEITVTIGRVDVRAVMTSSAPPPRRESRPTTTSFLDQYLKERSEGHR